MNVEVHGSGVEVTNRLRSYIERRAELGLDRFSGWIDSVLVTLEDANGPRGGVDQICRVSVNLPSQKKPLVAESVHEEAGGAIKLAFDKIAHAVGRTLDRQQKKHKRTTVLT